MTPPALASYNDKLYAAFVRPNDKAVMWSHLDGQTWTAPERIGGDHSIFAPALVAGHGKLFYAVTGTNNSLYWRTFNGTTWGPVSKFEGYGSVLAPSLATYSGRVWLIHVGAEGRLFLDTHNGTSWSGPYGNNLNWQVGNPLALAPHGDHLWRISTGTGGTYFSTSDGGARWTNQGTNTHSDWVTPRGSAATAHGGKLWVILRAQDGTVRGIPWGAPRGAASRPSAPSKRARRWASRPRPPTTTSCTSCTAADPRHAR
ncbi:hypothetical protein ACIGBH_39530 [Streptomyces sp. NPDC085929]|uniref:hypothetical protein n=1 Tax=Streptomyces sp. NPDC085929 TaxID=3365739 RepID=UPI0037D3B87A